MNKRFAGMLVGTGMVLALTGCGMGGSPPATGQGAPPQLLAASGNDHVVGTLEQVHGSTLTIKDAQNGGSSSVQLAEGATLQRQQTVGPDALRAGLILSAFGQEHDGVIEASQIQLSARALDTQPPMVFGQDAPPPTGGMAAPQRGSTANGPVPPDADVGGGDSTMPVPGGDAAQGPPAGRPLSGVIEQVAGDIITVKTAEGSQRLRLANPATIMQIAEAPASSLKPGELVVASGENQGQLLVATSIEVLPAPSLP